MEELEKKLIQLIEELQKAKKKMPVPPPTIDPEDHPSTIQPEDVKKLVKDEYFKLFKNGQWSFDK
jgi:hypothetical protein